MTRGMWGKLAAAPHASLHSCAHVTLWRRWPGSAHPLKLAPVEALGPYLPPSHSASILPPPFGVLRAVWPACGPEVAVGRPGRVGAESLQQFLQAQVLALCTFK